MAIVMERNVSGPLVLAMAVGLMTFALLPAAGALSQTAVSNGIEPLKVTITTTEFKFAPAQIRIPAGRPITLVLDNSAGETEHGIVVPAFGFRLEVMAGEAAQKTFVFRKPGEYAFTCDLPGHREAGMRGTLIVSDSVAER